VLTLSVGLAALMQLVELVEVRLWKTGQIVTERPHA
jgi:hypothetical protein